MSFRSQRLVLCHWGLRRPHYSRDRSLSAIPNGHIPVLTNFFLNCLRVVCGRPRSFSMQQSGQFTARPYRHPRRSHNDPSERRKYATEILHANFPSWSCGFESMDNWAIRHGHTQTAADASYFRSVYTDLLDKTHLTEAFGWAYKLVSSFWNVRQRMYGNFVRDFRCNGR